jgi:hypothetical protein
MFSPLGSRGGTRKPPRSPVLLLFLSCMMVLASLLMARDLRTGPSPFPALRAPPPPSPKAGPIEVFYLDEDPAPAADSPSP